ncbi:hypothetical protein BSKO_13678 [Bryopsis sp. KO-2023]|nr:hypothetical protein BSKO_13678 [Bryopsis sp. KO-2023]
MRPLAMDDDSQRYISPFLQTTLIGQYGVQNWVLCILMALVIPVVKLIVDTLIYEPLGSLVLGHQYKKQKENNDKAKEGATLMARWRDSCWEFTVYACFTALGLNASYSEIWFADTRHFWIGCTQLPCEQQLTTGLVLLYTIEMGFYLQAIPSLLFTRGPKRKDHYQMLGHHVVTMVLVGHSFRINLARSGCMIFLTHDVSDVFLHLAKLIKYAKKETATTCGFVVFLCVWTGTRLYYFPRYIIPSCMYESMEFFVNKYDVEESPHWEILNGSLWILFCLHIFWTYLILRVVFRMLSAKGVSDVREDDDD